MQGVKVMVKQVQNLRLPEFSPKVLVACCLCCLLPVHVPVHVPVPIACVACCLRCLLAEVV